MYFSDVYSSARCPPDLVRNEMLWGECISGNFISMSESSLIFIAATSTFSFYPLILLSWYILTLIFLGALYWNDFLRLAKQCGFRDPRLVKDSPITMDNMEVTRMLRGIEFYSATYRLFKIPDLDSDCEDYGIFLVDHRYINRHCLFFHVSTSVFMHTQVKPWSTTEGLRTVLGSSILMTIIKSVREKFSQYVEIRTECWLKLGFGNSLRSLETFQPIMAFLMGAVSLSRSPLQLLGQRVLEQVAVANSILWEYVWLCIKDKSACIENPYHTLTQHGITKYRSQMSTTTHLYVHNSLQFRKLWCLNLDDCEKVNRTEQFEMDE